MATILGANSESDAYEISNSLRFNDDDSAKLSRTFDSGGSQQKFTFSTWVKRANLGSGYGDLFGTNLDSGESAGSKSLSIGFTSSNTFTIDSDTGAQLSLSTTKVFRDPAAWYHIVVAVDTTQGTEANRVKLYVNGIQETLSGNFPSQNMNTAIGRASEHTIGADYNSFFDGYMADIYFVNNQQYDQTYFGKFDSNGVWIPVENGTGAGGAITFGTNGFFMQFKQTGTSQNSSGIGADTSGEDHHFAVTNLASHDVVTDTPTNNFCTLNPLDTRDTLSEGNLKRVSPQGASTSTISVGSGKWYVEFLVVTQGAILSGFVEDGYATHGNAQPHDHGDNALFYTSTGQKIINNSFTSYGSTASAGDIVGCAFDLDNDTAQFFINNSSQGTFSKTYTTGASYFFAASDVTTATNSTDFINFGHDSSFAGAKTAQNNSDDNGHGDFYYSPPSGFLAICTKNVAETG